MSKSNKIISIFFISSMLSPLQASIFKDSALEAAEKMNYSGRITLTNKSGMAIASGALVSLYTSENGAKRALGLTTAHTFLDNELQPEAYDSVTFSTDGFHSTTIQTAFIPNSLKMQHGQRVNDISLFLTGELPEKMDATTMPLYTGVGYSSRPNLEAFVVGYGNMYEPGATRELCSDYKRRRGFTSTTFYSKETDFKGHPCFRTFLKGSLTTEEIMRERFINGFSNTLDDKIQLKFGKKDLWVCAHKNQVSFSSACSGSPLIFKTSTGFKVAGVLSQTSIETLDAPLFEKQPLVVHTFEAVPSHPWLVECAAKFA
jgi:hypothetical protein